MQDTVKVKFDVAGFYFSAFSEPKKGATLQALMGQIASGSTDPRFSFGTSGAAGNLFVDQIAVVFKDAAPQPRQSGLEGYLKLNPGRFAARDETRVLTSAGVAELTWQYYANAATFHGDKVTKIGHVLNAEADPTDATRRTVVPFSRFTITEDCLITWRLIAIMVAGDPLP